MSFDSGRPPLLASLLEHRKGRSCRTNRANSTKNRLGRLLAERQEIENRLRQLEQVPAKGPNPDALVTAILAGLEDARKLFEHGTMEERKRVIRAFVENLTVDGVGGSGELRSKRIPDALSIRDSFKVVAGTRCEVQQRDGAREIEVIPLRFSREGTGWVLVGAGAEAARAAWG